MAHRRPNGRCWADDATNCDKRPRPGHLTCYNHREQEQDARELEVAGPAPPLPPPPPPAPSAPLDGSVLVALAIFGQAARQRRLLTIRPRNRPSINEE